MAPWSPLTVQAGPANGWTFGAMQAWRGPLSGAILSHPTQISVNPIEHFKKIVSLSILYITIIYILYIYIFIFFNCIIHIYIYIYVSHEKSIVIIRIVRPN